jgi:DNA-binding GntR family transcriptional regulator
MHDVAGTRDESPREWLSTFAARWRGASGIDYRDLAAALREDIRAERLPVDARLPSQRELARMLAVGRTTVVGAYNVLLGERLVRPSRGAGTWVVAQPGERAPDLHS